MEYTKLYIHVGLHKTGTTFLQKEFYTKFNNITYLGKDTNNKSIRAITRLGNKKLLISHEGILGTEDELYNGNIWDQANNLFILSKIFPCARIIISFRKHINYIISFYKQYLKRGGTKKLIEFYNPICNQGIMKDEHLNYMKLINLVENNFTHKPLVFLFEELILNPLELFDRISHYLEEKTPCDISITKYNRGVRYYQGELLRILNRLDSNTRIKEYRGIIPLNNKLTRYLRITPYQLCSMVGQFNKKDYVFSKEFNEIINSKFKSDWQSVCKYVGVQHIF